VETDAYLLYFRAGKKTRSIVEENSGGQAGNEQAILLT
jgi:hypothetical protein